MSDALPDVNNSFRDAYATRKGEAKSDDPILVVLADELVLLRGGQRKTVRYTPSEFHDIKTAAHAPLALWLHGPTPELRARLEGVKDPHPLVKATLDAMNDPKLDRDAFAKRMGPLLREAVAAATKLQLEELHARTEDIVAELDPGERGHLHVAVTGDHQARQRSLGMQYFVKRLGEDRVLYAEGVGDIDQAAALVGATRLNRAMATAFFGDAKRLERDVLGDAAKAILDQTDLAPIR